MLPFAAMCYTAFCGLAATCSHLQPHIGSCSHLPLKIEASTGYLADSQSHLRLCLLLSEKLEYLRCNRSTSTSLPQWWMFLLQLTFTANCSSCHTATVAQDSCSGMPARSAPFAF